MPRSEPVVSCSLTEAATSVSRIGPMAISGTVAGAPQGRAWPTGDASEDPAPDQHQEGEQVDEPRAVATGIESAGPVAEQKLEQERYGESGKQIPEPSAPASPGLAHRRGPQSDE